MSSSDLRENANPTDIHDVIEQRQEQQEEPIVEEQVARTGSATPVIRLREQDRNIPQYQQQPVVGGGVTNVRPSNIAARTITTTTTVLAGQQGQQGRYNEQGQFLNVNFVREPTVDFFNRFVAKDTHCLLGRTGVKISRICLGTMNFGEISDEFGNRPGQLSESEAFTILDRYIELGGNCIDTADFFPWFGNDVGKTEEIIGNWLSKQKREKVFLITKVRMPFDANNINSIGLSRKHLLESVECSLKRLQTEYIDMLMLNGWDNSVAFADTVRNLHDLVKSERIRYIGVCDFKGWQLQKFIDTAKMLNLHKCVCYMGQYNLLARGCEWEVIEVCKNERIGFIAYSPLKYGFLTSESVTQHNSVSVPSGSRIDIAAANNMAAMAQSFEQLRRDATNINVVTYCQMLARKYRVSISQIAIQWLLQTGVVTSVCVGVENVKQLEEIMQCLEGQFVLSKEDMDELNYYSQVQLHYPYHTQLAQVLGFKTLRPIENQTQFEQLNVKLTPEHFELEPERRMANSMQRLNMQETSHEALNLDFPEREFMRHVQTREFPISPEQRKQQQQLQQEYMPMKKKQSEQALSEEEPKREQTVVEESRKI